MYTNFNMVICIFYVDLLNNKHYLQLYSLKFKNTYPIFGCLIVHSFFVFQLFYNSVTPNHCTMNNFKCMKVDLIHSQIKTNTRQEERSSPMFIFCFSQFMSEKNLNFDKDIFSYILNIKLLKGNISQAIY